MRDTDYAFCVAKVRANETKLLSADFINRLVEADDYSSAVRLLRSIDWIEADVNEGFIKKQSDNLWNLLEESVPDKEILNYLCILNDYHNIKTAVKCIISDEEAIQYYAEPSSLELDELQNSIDSCAFLSIKSEEMRKTAKEAFEIACKSKCGQDVEAIIDVAALEALRKASGKCRHKIFFEICTFLIDTSNIRTAIRCAAVGKNRDFTNCALSECIKINKNTLVNIIADGSEALKEYLLTSAYSEGVEIYYNNPALYDKWCERRLLEIAADSKYTAFGFDPVCAYFYRKNNEIKTVKLILTAKKSGIPIEMLRERIVTYA